LLVTSFILNRLKGCQKRAYHNIIANLNQIFCQLYLIFGVHIIWQKLYDKKYD
jgi:hypothetical protein